MYRITATGEGTYVARDDAELVDRALDFSGRHGNPSGAEDWSDMSVRELIVQRIEDFVDGRTESFELYIPGEREHVFTAEPCN